MHKKFLFAIFETEETLLKAAQGLKKRAIKIFDIFTPYAVHGLDEAMGLKRSWLPIVCFFAGASGCVLALWLQIWTSAVSWPINVGGKPFNSLPAFIPITFEMTILFAGLITTAAFFMRSKLFPGKPAIIFNHRVTDDRFVIAIKEPFDEKMITELMNESGAVLVDQEEINL